MNQNMQQAKSKKKTPAFLKKASFNTAKPVKKGVKKLTSPKKFNFAKAEKKLGVVQR